MPLLPYKKKKMPVLLSDVKVWVVKLSCLNSYCLLWMNYSMKHNLVEGRCRLGIWLIFQQWDWVGVGACGELHWEWGYLQLHNMHILPFTYPKWFILIHNKSPSINPLNKNTQVSMKRKLLILYSGGSLSVISIVIGNGIVDQSSNPGQGCLCFSLC